MTERDDYLGAELHDEREAAVYLVAHESRHVWQRDHLGVVSEADACAYGIRILSAFRRGALKVTPRELEPDEVEPVSYFVQAMERAMRT